MADLHEVWEGIADILAADSTLTGKLNSSDEIYIGRNIARRPQEPCLRIWCIDDHPNESLSGYGDYRPELQIDIFGKDPIVLEEIKERMSTLLEIPRVRADQITTTNYTVMLMRRRSAITVGSIQLREDDKPWQHVATEWLLRVTSQ